MKKTTKKKLFIASLLCAYLLVSSCNTKETIIDEQPVSYNNENQEIIEVASEVTEPIKEEVTEEPSIEEETEYTPDYSLDYNTDEINVIKTNNKTPIYDADKNIIGYFTNEHDYMLIDEDETNYLINYYGKNGFVNKKDTYQTTKKVINTEMISKGYVTNDTPIYDNYELIDEYDTLKKLEFVEIYMELDNSYLVQTLDTVGFIPKDNVKLLEGNLAVVDRSNQELRLYENNNLTICTPVVTGTRNTDRQSDLGLFTVHTKAENLDIIPNTHVDVVTYYNGGEGIHDAYWRKTQDFGGDTYIGNGSHGCINTPHDEAVYVYKVLQKGEKVLVKE